MIPDLIFIIVISAYLSVMDVSIVINGKKAKANAREKSNVQRT